MSRRVFINRETLRKEFPIRYNNYMNNRFDNKIGDVLYYQGDGGIGKSTLLEEFENMLSTEGNVIKKFDFDIKDLKNPISFLLAIREAFANDIDFPLFDFAYLTYVKRAHIEPDKRINHIKPLKETINLIQSFAEVDVIEFWNSICRIYNYVEQKSKIKQYIDYVENIRGDSAKVIEKDLVKYLAKDINIGILNKMPEKGVLIFLDTFEQVTSYSNDYIGNDLVNIILDETDGLISNMPLVLFIIASREPCEIGCLSRIPNMVKDNKLEIWKETDAIKFITENSKIEDIDFCKKLAKCCQYYPFYLNLALDHIEHSLNSNYKEMDISNLNSKKMLEMFLRGLDADYRNTLIILSCQIDWDKDLFNKVIQQTNWPTVQFETIKKYSFIKTVPHKPNKITVHQIMRECIEKYDNTNFLLIKNEIHSILREIYNYKKYDLKRLVQESLGEKNLLNQYIYHSSWLIKNNNRKEERNRYFNCLFDELKALLNQLKDSGSAKILLNPLETVANLAVWLYGEDCSQYIDCHYQIAFVQTYSGNLHLAEKADRKVYLTYKNILEKELEKNSITLEELHSLRILEDNMVKARGSMAYDMCRNGKYLEAIREGEECLEHAYIIWGKDDVKTLPIQSNVSYYKLKNNDIENGIKLAEDVLERRENLYQRTNLQVLLSKRNLGVQYRRLDLKKAIDLVQESYIGFDTLYGFENGHTLESRQYYANFLIRDKQYDLAINHLKEIFVIRKEIDGEYHPNVVDCLTYLSFAYLGKSKEDIFNKEKLQTCAIDKMKKAYNLAKIVFDNNESKWKIAMYQKVLNKVSEFSNVNELIAFLDSYNPSK